MTDSTAVRIANDRYDIPENEPTVELYVDWDTTDDENPDGYPLEDIGLDQETFAVPKCLVDRFNDGEQDDVSDWLSDVYGWLVNGWEEA